DPPHPHAFPTRRSSDLFKVLFDRLDVDAVDGDVKKLPTRDVKEVVDLCYQCKLCFNHCPYTPPHRWEVDFPRLMLRARAAEARRSEEHTSELQSPDHLV